MSEKTNLQPAWPVSIAFLWQVLPELLTAQRFPGQEAGCAQPIEIIMGRQIEKPRLRVSKKSKIALDISCMFLHHVACSDVFFVMSCE